MVVRFSLGGGVTDSSTGQSPAPFAAYLVIVAGWFFGFGLQTTLFPGIVYFTLANPPNASGWPKWP